MLSALARPLARPSGGKLVFTVRGVAVASSSSSNSSSSSSSSSSSGSSTRGSTAPGSGATTKHKVPQKRASAMLSVLRTEEYTKLRKARDFSAVRAGDSVLVERLPYISSNEPDKIKGLVIATTNRSSDSALVLLYSEHGTPTRRRILMYSPLVQNITVLQKSFIHKGDSKRPKGFVKRVRRSKLYYLEERNADSFTVN